MSHGRLIFLITLFIAEFSIMPSEVGFHRERADTSTVIVIKEICVAAIRAQSFSSLNGALKSRCTPFADGEHSLQ